ncbi:MAG: PQQ-binding-like beta-propeller repeat protein [Acidobacteriaceae bacterium]
MHTFALRSLLLAISLAFVPHLSAVTISPANATMKEYATLQYKASVAVTWSTNCGGTISSSGVFKAPLYPKTCTITAKATNGSGSASTSVHIVSPIVMTPVSATTPQGKTQQFTASAPVKWVARCGSITAGGLFTASAPVGSSCGVNGTALSGPAYTVYGYDKIASPTTSFSVSPATASLSEAATQQFTATAAATWSASCGAVSSSGLFTAPLTPASCTITATNSSGSKATATATVTSRITITPSSAATPQNQTQQFSANVPVTWSASCGSINGSGLFTATSAPGTKCTIQAVAASGPAYTAYAYDTSGAAAAVTITPSNPTLSEGAAQPFSANVPVTWAASCGVINATTGAFTAPFVTGSCKITATATSGGSVGSTTATITTPITITPAAASTAPGQTQQFAANMAVNWSASCGIIDGTGLFTASAASGSTCAIQATASSGPAYTATATDTIGGQPVTLTVSPSNPTLNEGATQQFSASAPVTWTTSCGVINGSGSFTAPLRAGSCSVTATASDGSGKTASTTATVTSPFSISPETLNLHALGKQSFTASVPVTWSASCGAIDPNAGTYTAPGTTGSCAVTATASSGMAFTHSATVNVDTVNYVQWRNTLGGTGWQSNELLLTPSNVSSSLGQKWSASVDGGVWAEPLYMNGLTINGVSHNVLFVATDNDSVYALDGDTGTQLWQHSFLSSGVTKITPALDGDPYIPAVGVLGTPVIDPAGGTIYVVSETGEQSGSVLVHRLHALDLTTGNEKLGGPVMLSDPNLATIKKLQRPGLLLVNNTVYVSIGSMQDLQTYHGFIFGFDKNSLAQKAIWNVTPTGSEGGIWMSGAAPVADTSGNIYVTTGNGTFNGSTNFGESVVKLSPSLQVLDYFAPYDRDALSAGDRDLGSGSVVIVPDQGGQYPHELIACGKPTPVYVLNRDSMGHAGSSSDNIIQRLDTAIGGSATGRDQGQPCFVSPAIIGQNVYFAANGDVLKQFTLNSSTGLLSTTPTSKGSSAYSWPGSQIVISSNGQSSPIVWSFDITAKTLRANDANNVSTTLYVSPAIATGYLKWVTPTVVNGYIFVGGQGTVVGFTVH